MRAANVTSQQNQYDYIVVGGGSAGSIVAARLAEEGAGSVLLLECGDAGDKHPETLTEDGFKYAFANDDLMFHRMSAPQEGCGGRKLFLGTGRGMGGSGAVNGMVYTRGDKRDFERWPKGWHYDDLVPHFEAVEKRIGIRPRVPTPFAQRFIDASVSAGFTRKDGMNDGELGGVVGCNDMNYDESGRRSSYRAWLHERQVPNLQIVTNASVRRLVFGDSQRAVGVECEIEGQIKTFDVSKEVVLCAGALETPKILMLSGVGPRQEIEAQRIRLIKDIPGVGQHLHDHPNVCVFYRAEQPVDFKYPQLYGFDAARRPAHAQTNEAPDTCFVCFAAPGTLHQSMHRMVPLIALPGPLYKLGFLRSFYRVLIDLAFKLPWLQRYVSTVFGIVVILGKPDSRGSIGLNSADPAAPARIDPAYFKSPRDRETLLAGIAKARQIAEQPALAQAGAKPLSLGGTNASEEKIWKWATAATMTTFHFCGSCRMGDDVDSPVDTKLRVKGLRNVRVADASVMPEIPVSALNAPSMMIGYRAANFILEGKSS
ncbi:hypothetical protein CJD38_16135 [Stenotrophobium rhamnosiphilum]|uniref:Glucose-methanol-choline oxidoreductase N-terminal domain-containing protein n=1 Tax=Stenotrophobium rhamnosiphilum TaxID=2029166 RepID=A0A2T5MBX9_9GAMM|nr:hypothetical protein CJD38_16135 [Stenotrophobium rhamnosiphilum]